MDTQNKNIIADIRSENVSTYEETYTPEVAEGEEAVTQTATYKFFNVNGVFGKVLDKLSYIRTHAAASWYNKLAGITVKDKIDELNSDIETLNSKLVGGIARFSESPNASGWYYANVDVGFDATSFVVTMYFVDANLTGKPIQVRKNGNIREIFVYNDPYYAGASFYWLAIK